MTRTQVPARPVSSRDIKAAALIAGVFLGFCGVGGIGLAIKNHIFSSQPSLNSADAEHSCQQFVVDRVNASASWTWASATREPGQWVVGGYLDSPNSTRADVMCTVTRWGSGNWKLDDLQITPRA